MFVVVSAALSALRKRVCSEVEAAFQPTRPQEFTLLFKKRGCQVADVEPLKREWQDAFERAMYEAVEDIMGDPGELNDGELPSRTRQNMEESGFAENVDADPEPEKEIFNKKK